MHTNEVATAVIGILDRHKGTAGEFCGWCDDYIPSREDREKFSDRELTMRHQGLMVAQYIQEVRADEIDTIAQIIGHPTVTPVLMERAEKVRKGHI